MVPKKISSTMNTKNATHSPQPIFLMMRAAFGCFFSKKKTGNPNIELIIIQTTGKVKPSMNSFTSIPLRKNHRRPLARHMTTAIRMDFPRGYFILPSLSSKPNSSAITPLELHYQRLQQKQSLTFLRKKLPSPQIHHFLYPTALVLLHYFFRRNKKQQKELFPQPDKY